MSQLADAALLYAQTKIGVTETSNNSGPEIDQWLAAVHAEPGSPWCAAFLWECFEEGAHSVGEACLVPRTASTLRMWALAEAEHYQASPQPGDIYVLQHSPHTGHVGIVETVVDGQVATECSGNTFADGGGREGNCVARHSGPPEKTHGGVLLGFLRY